MNRRDFLRLSTTSIPLLASGCVLARLNRIDKWSYLIRSDVIETPEQEKEILGRAKLGWTDNGRIRVLVVSGTPYERGYQQGALLRQEVHDNIGYLYNKALSKFHFDEMFDEAFERMQPFIPQEYLDEMHGLAHGARMPLKVIHAIHALPEIGEWGGTKRIRRVVKDMMDGKLGTTCSNFCMTKGATADDKMYTVRMLDWGLHRISRLHEYPLITINKPIKGYASANIGWIGFLGAISGMNEKGITLGEMGYGNPPGESLRGKPMPFLLRDVLTYSKNLAEVRKIIKDSVGTSSYIFVMSDGKSKESELYVRDRSRFVVYKPNQRIVDGKNDLPPIPDTLYGGHYHDKMTELLTTFHGKLAPEIIMKELIPHMAMPSNFQNVIYDPVNLAFWVSNARSKDEPAAFQPYSFFDFAKVLKQ